MHGNTHRLAFIAALILLLGSLAATLLGTKVRAAPDHNPAQDNILISEFRSRGPALNFEGSDDFVEIYNPTDQEIDLSGWILKSVTSSGVFRMQYRFDSGASLLPGQHFLIVGMHYSGSKRDDAKLLFGGIPDDGGVALIGADDTTIIDLAGMSPLAAEATPLAPLSGNLDQSYERKPGGADGTCFDTDDNAADFGLRAPSDPQNSTDISTGNLCALVTGTDSPSPTETATPTASYTFTETVPDEETLTPAGTATFTETRTHTYTRTPSSTNTAPPTETLANTPTETSTRTASATRTPSLTRTWTYTRTDRFTRTASLTRTPAFTHTPSLTRTLTYTRTDTTIRTGTPSRTASLTKTATYTGTITRTRAPTRTVTTRPGFVILNEFLPHPNSDWSQDGSIDGGDEYIELTNLSTAPVDLKNWKIDNGGNGQAFTLPEFSLLPGQIKVFFRFETHIAINGEGGTLRLRNPQGRTADSFTYHRVEVLDRTWCRLSDGGPSLTFACDPTPGRPNVPFKTGSIPLYAKFSCRLPEAVPAAIAAAQCSGMGEGIWRPPLRVEVMIDGQGKWETFVE